jgi:hypothetical protein
MSCSSNLLILIKQTIIGGINFSHIVGINLNKCMISFAVVLFTAPLKLYKLASDWQVGQMGLKLVLNASNARKDLVLIFFWGSKHAKVKACTARGVINSVDYEGMQPALHQRKAAQYAVES